MYGRNNNNEEYVRTCGGEELSLGVPLDAFGAPVEVAEDQDLAAVAPPDELDARLYTARGAARVKSVVGKGEAGNGGVKGRHS